MALKYEGYTAADWEDWSKRDGSRYHPGECFKKWTTFEGSGVPVTGATITQMAKDNGWMPRSTRDDHELDWNDEISGGEYVVIDKNWIEGKEIHEPTDWNPVQQLTTYLVTLFEASENVGYVVDTWQNDEGKYLPTKGAWDRTAGELIQALNECNGDIGAVLGDYISAAGAWIRFNPLDGKGVKNENVSDFRYALVESDTMDIEKQNAIMRELDLPIAVMVYSGGKSIHAIVRIDAAAHAYLERYPTGTKAQLRAVQDCVPVGDEDGAMLEELQRKIVKVIEARTGTPEGYEAILTQLAEYQDLLEIHAANYRSNCPLSQLWYTKR
ncbi:PriCT-2 domain-containing protein [Paenibacillus sp. MER 180]|uniref:PriCT-2 domain-containing protein n=1 Tax=Paenibacillus sp. MER 180 TaxID=2939570 RepID=UPI00203AD6F4|nr:PriCT-2 domain-containing protein [Paenibacillus sp. MER 180]MCM3291635.1 PriCT-2 domain-containing protein [Paenibacillus sp. MER 180]